jgi:hypothetical protein
MLLLLSFELSINSYIGLKNYVEYAKPTASFQSYVGCLMQSFFSAFQIPLHVEVI